MSTILKELPPVSGHVAAQWSPISCGVAGKRGRGRSEAILRMLSYTGGRWLLLLLATLLLLLIHSTGLGPGLESLEELAHGDHYVQRREHVLEVSSASFV